LRVQDSYENFDLAGAYGVSLVLAVMSVIVLIAMTVLKPKEEA
jgi:ABC-type sulfate transport system permease subunit